MRSIISFVIGAFIIIMGSSALAQELTWKNQKGSAKECAMCHYEMMDEFVYGKGSDIALMPVGKEVASERMCFSCHDGSVADSRMRVWDSQMMAHKTSMGLKPGMHPPSTLPLTDGKVTCMTCHTAHGDGKNAKTSMESSLFLRMSNEDSKLCMACHEGMKEHTMQKLDKKLIPGVLEKGGRIAKDGKMSCETCHAVHGAKNDNLTIANAKDLSLCKVCHMDMFIDPKTGEEVLKPHVPSGKPVDAKVAKFLKDNNRVMGDKGDLVCYSCHDIHGSKGEHLLFASKKGEDFCLNCHTGFEKIVDSPHDLAKIAGFKNVDGKTVAETGRCAACHGGHKWKTVFKGEKIDLVTQICTNCHKMGGVASKKNIDITRYNHYVDEIDPAQFTDLKRSSAKELAKLAKEFLKSFSSKTKALKMLVSDGSMSCITCHDIHNGDKLFLRASVENGVLCLNCHSEQEPVVTSSHGKGKLYGCTSCHQLHNAQSSMLIRNSDDKNNGCPVCHSPEVKDGKTPRGLLVKMPAEFYLPMNNHPTGISTKDKFPEPAFNQPTGMFSCASCHNPHEQGKNNVFKGKFVRTDSNIKNAEDFCLVCHANKKDVVGSAHDIDSNKVVNAKTGRKATVCETCHRVHNAKTSADIFAFDIKSPLPDGTCLTCHSEGGEAKNAAINMKQGHKLGVLSKAPAKDQASYYYQAKDGKYYLYCKTCHNPHVNGPKKGSEGDIRNSFLRKLDNTSDVICQSCHKDQSMVAKGGHGSQNFKVSNAKAKLAKELKDPCTYCHTTHNSESPYLMPGKTDEERCMYCHDGHKDLTIDILTKSHPTNVDVKDKKALPLSDSGKITCKTCHVAHDSKPELIRSNNGMGDELCGTCHNDKKAVVNSKHNMRISPTKDTKIAELSKYNVCEPCHSSHNANSRTAIDFSSGSENQIKKSCLGCHSTWGAASAKIPAAIEHPNVIKVLAQGNQDFKRFGAYLYAANGKLSSKDGEITCATCHDPHVWSSNPSLVNEYNKAGMKVDGTVKTDFLRKDVATAFCGVCHNNPQEWFEKYHSVEFRDKNKIDRMPKSLLQRIYDMLKR